MAVPHNNEGIPIEESVPLARSWSRFSRTLKQSLLALSADLGGLAAGLVLFTYLDVFSSATWVILLYPSILSIRGIIGGLFCGRLGTGLHLGIIKPSFTKNTRDFHLLFYATFSLMMQSTLMIGAIASLFSISFWGASLVDAVSIFSTVITTITLSFLLASPITLAVSVLAFRYGLDPDIISYPVMSTVSDIFDTICFILVLKILFAHEYLGSFIIGLLDVVSLFFALYILAKYRKEDEFAKTMKESLLAFVIVAFIVNITGNALEKISQMVGNRREIYILYPALIDTIGDVGSIVGSTATTRFALGTIEPSFRSIRRNMPEVSGVCLSSAIWFVLFSLISFYLAHGAFVPKELWGLVAILLTLNLMAVPIVSVIAYSVAVLTHKKGLDPDNFVIPIGSSLADSVTTICLLTAIILWEGNLLMKV